MSESEKKSVSLTIFVATVSIVAGCLGFLFLGYVQHTMEITSIESNRFTASDALEVWKEIASIKASQIELSNHVPLWLESRVDEIKEDNKVTQAELRQLQKEVNDIKVKISQE